MVHATKKTDHKTNSLLKRCVVLTPFPNSSNKGFLFTFFFFFLYQWSFCAFCFISCFPLIAHSLLYGFSFSFSVSFSLPVSLLCLCSFAMLMLGKWEVATHTDTCTASVLIISKRTASSLSLSGTVQCIPRGKKEMNALRALIQLVHVQINKECNILPMTENGI